mgnify:FL=1|jgi:hypothetical protein|tara:strand:+ start:2049 stop:2930 length:882 start_codon:yes stop_codon:yes gene_type:complete
MKSEEILKIIPSISHPVGLGGCHAGKTNFDCCAYDITIFDETDTHESIIQKDGKFFKIHHCALSENRIESLVQLQNMQILSDERWELQMFLAKVSKKQDLIFNAFTKNNIIESQICLTKAQNGLGKSDPFVSSWIKSAGYFLADAILSSNNYSPSPSHMLDILRNLESNQINETLSIILDSLGLERATPSLLARMEKSAIGLSDLVEKNNNSKIIQQKINCFIEKSLFADCYFYIGYVNRNNFYRIKNSLDDYPELIHILKTGFDLEYDSSTYETTIQSLTKVIEIILKSTHE